jgi:hypothetical protein
VGYNLSKMEMTLNRIGGRVNVGLFYKKEDMHRHILL